jgi:FHA domain
VPHPCHHHLVLRSFRSSSDGIPFFGFFDETKQQASQQTVSQPEMLTQNPDLTQTYGDDMDDDEEDDGLLLSPYLESSSSQGRTRRRRGPPMPWGRLVPCGGGGLGGGDSTNNDDNPQHAGSSRVGGGGAAGGNHKDPPVQQAPIDLMPRPAKPQQPVYESAAGAGARAGAAPNHTTTTNDDDNDEDLESPRPGDIFNEYVIGRSAKCDVVIPKHAILPSGAKLSEWVYSLVSNKHARIYCLQQTAPPSSSANAAAAGLGPTSTTVINRGYEVYVEDTSHNGTVVNGTVLRKCERRILNSGTFLVV